MRNIDIITIVLVLILYLVARYTPVSFLQSGILILFILLGRLSIKNIRTKKQ
ncbi:MAG: hypothetical protein K0S51_1209 [Bacillales bacterium]|jgi:hypothetical protein|nr:hypothetical protein [Bacillales bacterium]